MKSTERVDATGLLLRDIGEFGLIDQIAKLLTHPAQGSAGATVAIGDDAAAWRPSPGSYSVVTTDTMVEGVHFRRSTISWHDLGWKALAMNVSDIAAMGARPRFAVVTIGMPAETPVTAVLELYAGLRELADRFDMAIVGGDTVAAPLVIVGAAVTGEARPLAHALDDTVPLLLRSAAQPGDGILVTGYLGAAAAGFRLVEQGGARNDPAAARLMAAHRRPLPRVAEAEFLRAHHVLAGADNSDGLLQQVRLLCVASGVGALIDSRLLPIDPDTAACFPDAVDLALRGGESYELVITAPHRIVAALREAWDAAYDLPLTEVGTILARDRGLTVLDLQGRPTPAGVSGFDHYAAGKMP